MAKSPGRPRGSSKPVFNHPEKAPRASIPEEKEPTPNFDLLSDELKAKLREEARIAVDVRERKRAEEAYLAAEEERIERELHPEAHEEEREIYIDLALYADRVIIDGKHYMHGRNYTVKESTYRCMQDIIARTHKHYAETHRDPNTAMMEAAQSIAKGGHPGRAAISASDGKVTKF